MVIEISAVVKIQQKGEQAENMKLKLNLGFNLSLALADLKNPKSVWGSQVLQAL